MGKLAVFVFCRCGTSFREEFAPLFGRTEARSPGEQYLRGLSIQQTDRRSAENLDEIGYQTKAELGLDLLPHRHKEPACSVSNHVRFPHKIALRKPAEAQWVHVEADSATFKDHLGDQLTGDWPMHEAMTAEAGHDVEPARVGHAVYDRMRVWSHFVQSCPFAQDSSAF
jgi:hypothetical protein